MLMPKGLLKREPRKHRDRKPDSRSLPPERAASVFGGGERWSVAALPFGEGFVPDQAHAAERGEGSPAVQRRVSLTLYARRISTTYRKVRLSCKRSFLPTAKAGASWSISG